MPQALAPTGSRVPLVDYLVLEPHPHLVARQCANCQAQFLDRRTACAGCSATEFVPVALPVEGTIDTFTIVHQAAPGVAVPFVAAIVECGGTRVAGNLHNVAPDAGHVSAGMPVRMSTYSLGVDIDGIEAVGFSFEPI